MTTTFDKDVPYIPTVTKRRTFHGFELMKPGDSKFIPDGHTPGTSGAKAVSAFRRAIWGNTGWKGATRTLEENFVKGVRVWRLE